MEPRAILDRIDALKAEIDTLRPIDQEQKARVRHMLRIDGNYHSNALQGNTLRLREQLASYDG